ncbi:YoaK family protein [Lysobacter sp. HA35]
MIGRLPRWVWPVAWLLAFAAGAVNAVGLLSVARQSVSHLTGATTLLATSLVAGDAIEITKLLAVVVAFVAGAALAGAVMLPDALRLGRRQGAVLATVSMLLLFAHAASGRWPVAALAFAAGACGLQNAMTTAYSGAVVRTSHVSGMFTDLGMALGHVLRGERFDRGRVLLCVAVISGFFAGGLVAAALYGRYGTGVLVVPASVTGALAVANVVHVVRARRTIGPS